MLARNLAISYMVTSLTHLCRMEFPTPINWTGQSISILRVVGCRYFHFYSKINRKCCKHFSGDPDQMPHSAASDLGPTEKTLGIYGLKFSIGKNLIDLVTRKHYFVTCDQIRHRQAYLLAPLLSYLLFAKYVINLPHFKIVIF